MATVVRRCCGCKKVKEVDDFTRTCETCRGITHHQHGPVILPVGFRNDREYIERKFGPLPPEPPKPPEESDPDGWCAGGHAGYWMGPVPMFLPYKSPGRRRCPSCGRMLTLKMADRDAWATAESRYHTFAAVLPPHKRPDARRRRKGPRRKERRFVNNR